MKCKEIIFSIHYPIFRCIPNDVFISISFNTALNNSQYSAMHVAFRS